MPKKTPSPCFEHTQSENAAWCCGLVSGRVGEAFGLEAGLKPFGIWLCGKRVEGLPLPLTASAGRGSATRLCPKNIFQNFIIIIILARSTYIHIHICMFCQAQPGKGENSGGGHCGSWQLAAGSFEHGQKVASSKKLSVFYEIFVAACVAGAPLLASNLIKV